MARYVKDYQGTFRFGLVFGESISLDEMKQWRQEAVRGPCRSSSFFRRSDRYAHFAGNDLDPETQEEIADGIQLFKRAGMLYSCIILDSVAATAQYKRRARESRGYSHERYINATVEPRWRIKAVEWLEKQIDPDL